MPYRAGNWISQAASDRHLPNSSRVRFNYGKLPFVLRVGRVGWASKAGERAGLVELLVSSPWIVVNLRQIPEELLLLSVAILRWWDGSRSVRAAELFICDELLHVLLRSYSNARSSLPLL